MPWGRHRILVAEDDPQLRDVLREVLALDGFEVCCVGDGVAARERFASAGPFDALLLDDRMPQLSGRELLRELRAADEDVPVVLLSGHCQLEAAEWAALKPHALLRKPVAISAIASALREAIEKAGVESAGTTRWSTTRSA